MRLSIALRKLKRALGNESGSQLVEFAICCMVFLTLVLGICDSSRAMLAYHFVTHGAQEGSRWAMVRGASWTGGCSTAAPPSFSNIYACTASSTDVQNYVRSLGGFNPSSVTVATTWPGTSPACSKNCTACTTTNSPGCFVSVKVTYKFNFIVPFFKQTTVNLTASSVKIVQK